MIDLLCLQPLIAYVGKRKQGEGMAGEYQRIKDGFIIPNAREKWTLYRKDLTDLTESMGAGTLAVIGAGRCCDIDLERLTAVTDKVILVDIDRTGMEEALGQLPSEYRPRVELRQASLTGISEEDMEEICNDLLAYARKEGREVKPALFREQLMNQMNRLSAGLREEGEEGRDILPPDSVDVLLCSGVHSQLFTVFHRFIRSLLYSMKEYLSEAEELEQEAGERLKQMNDRVIPVINRMLCRAAKETIIFGNEFSGDRPVEGADRCIRDIRSTMKPTELHLCWEFDRAGGIVYDMLMQIVDFS